MTFSEFSNHNRFTFYSVLILLLGLASQGCFTPQVLTSEEALNSLDALWTAVTSHKPERLKAATDELMKLKAAGKFSEAGWKSLEPIIRLAQEGQWDTAAKRLQSFIKAQRKQS